MTKKKLLPIKGMSLKICIDCLTDKQYRVLFNKSPPHKRSHVLDLIHTDVYTIDARTLGGVLYFVTFIDDYVRKYRFLF